MTLRPALLPCLAVSLLSAVTPARAVDPCALLVKHAPQIMGTPLSSEPKPSKDIGGQVTCQVQGGKDASYARLTLRIWSFDESAGMKRIVEGERKGARENRYGGEFKDEPALGEGSYSVRTKISFQMRGQGKGRGVSAFLERGASSVTDADGEALRGLVRTTLAQR